MLRSSEWNENLQRLKAARLNALKVLSSYPDYGKATEGYTNGIVEAFAQFDEGIQLQLSHITLGLRSRHSYLPTVENVVSLANQLIAERARKADFEKRFSGRAIQAIEAPRKTYRPFPALWRALGSNADEILNGFGFDELADLAKLHATKGMDAVRNRLNITSKAA